jgi:hypothetical protein
MTTGVQKWFTNLNTPQSRTKYCALSAILQKRKMEQIMEFLKADKEERKAAQVKADAD